MNAFKANTKPFWAPQQGPKRAVLAKLICKSPTGISFSLLGALKAPVIPEGLRAFLLGPRGPSNVIISDSH